MGETVDPRHNSRRIALAALCCDASSNTSEERISASLDILEIKSGEYDVDLTNSLISEVSNNISEIETIITECAPDWPLDKIARVDLAILKMSIAEILYSKSTPEKVVIDEAVELAKEFGNDTSSKFVNGVLGTIIEIKLISELESPIKENNND